MTWYWELVDRTTIELEASDGTVYTLEWSDYGEKRPDANGWTWQGDYPTPVYNTVAEHDLLAAITDDIERRESDQ